MAMIKSSENKRGKAGTKSLKGRKGLLEEKLARFKMNVLGDDTLYFKNIFSSFSLMKPLSQNIAPFPLLLLSYFSKKLFKVFNYASLSQCYLKKGEFAPTPTSGVISYSCNRGEEARS